MIRVQPKPEPSDFETKVRRHGRAFLARCQGKPTKEEFKRNNHWAKAGADLYEAYDRVCAYTSRYIETSRGSVDHFVSKMKTPELAYEWSNFRLCIDRVNSHKGDDSNVIDPFLVEAGWFELIFPACLVRPGQSLAEELRAQIEHTISLLKLNSDDNVVQDRCEYCVSFAKRHVTIDFLRQRRPFLAAEIDRQGIDPTKAASLFKA